jgi:transcription elongation factor Elf1
VQRFLAAAAAVVFSMIAADGPPANPEGAFNHRQHAAFKMKCSSCHASAAKEERAGFPAVDTQCKACHTRISERKLPSARVYQLADFVIFSHAAHLSAKFECITCHGDVSQAASIRIERPITMIACVNCHKEHKATLVCTACHELGQ